MKKIKKTVVWVLVVTGLLVVSCKKENVRQEPDPFAHGNGVFICHEGTYLGGNASISFYDPVAGKVENQIFYNANNVPLGDVCLSMSIRGKLGFAVVNNSGKVYVFDTDTFLHRGTIGGLASPRYVHFVSDSKTYISSLGSSSLTIIDPRTLQVTGSVDLGVNDGPVATTGSEQMVACGNDLFVCSWSYNNKVFRIDTATDRVTGSVEVTKQPNSIVIDRNDKLWVLSDGGYPGSPYGEENAALTRIDARTFTVEQRYVFPDITSSPGKLTIDGNGQLLYFINGQKESVVGGVFAMAVTDTRLPEKPLIPEGENYFYGLGIDPVSGDIYVSDAVDYVQRGWVLRYTADGVLVDRFKTDIIPGSFCFKND